MRVYIVSAFVCLIVTLSADLCQSKPIKLSIFYETLCPDSIRFMTRQFYPTYNALGGFGNQYLEVDFVPYGKATTTFEDGKYSFECQHGPRECDGNRVHACALQHLPENSTTDFIICSMNSSDPPATGPGCAKKLGLDFTAVEKCVENEGSALLAEHGNRTHSLDPELYFVAWLLYDDIFNEKDLEDSQFNFQKVLCGKLASPLPPVCG